MHHLVMRESNFTCNSCFFIFFRNYTHLSMITLLYFMNYFFNMNILRIYDNRLLSNNKTTSKMIA